MFELYSTVQQGGKIISIYNKKINYTIDENCVEIVRYEPPSYLHDTRYAILGTGQHILGLVRRRSFCWRLEHAIPTRRIVQANGIKCGDLLCGKTVLDTGQQYDMIYFYLTSGKELSISTSTFTGYIVEDWDMEITNPRYIGR